MKYIISIGSNLENGRAVQNITKAFHLLKERFETVVCSEIIPTRAVDMEVDCRFFNAVICLQSTILPAGLKFFLKQTEREMGRIPRSDEVAIDMDIIMVDEEVVHEDYENRAFIRELIQTLGC